MTSRVAGREHAATIARLRAELSASRALLLRQAEELAHSRKIFERASEAARIGVWECSLPDERLRWTDVVYDIFELPRGSALDRGAALEFYTPASARELDIRRSRAIAERSSFTLDAEIVTAKGNRRWMRITANVECEGDTPVRIFGMKQDITEEKLLMDRTRYLAEFDVMTGLANRSRFQARLADIGAERSGSPPVGALILIDLDGFKRINDTFGHAAGDECLRHAAGRLLSACGGADLVARIGGDEFAVLLGTGHDRAATAALARQIVAALRQPVDYCGRTLELGASVGAALIEDSSPSALFMKADIALYAAKAAGRNTFQIFAPDYGQAVPPRLAAAGEDTFLPGAGGRPFAG